MKVFSTSMRNNIYYLDQDMKTSNTHNSVSVIEYTTASDEGFLMSLKTIIKFHKLKFSNGV